MQPKQDQATTHSVPGSSFTLFLCLCVCARVFNVCSLATDALF